MNPNIKDLDYLIAQHGIPDALIDNHSSKKGYAIWGFSDFFRYSEGQIIHNGLEVEESPLILLQNLINLWQDDDIPITCVGFLSYDIKNIFYPHIKFKPLKGEFPYIWFAKPKIIKSYALNSSNIIKDKKILSINRDFLDFYKYEKKILKIKDELKVGNTYQINFTMNKLFETKLSSFETYLAIREKAKPAFGYYLNIGEEQILSFSPEEFFHTKGKTIKTYPMKGTTKRGKTKTEDNNLKQDLKNSAKNQAEHIMIVDLLRNDLGKICKYGSVKVEDLFKINSYETVHQMVSCVYGTLKNNIKHIDILKALCPGGSVTGAPKESSMKIIDLLESYNREIYTGTIGYIDSQNNMHFNMAIRTMMIKNNMAKYSVGGGIVWDSNPLEEFEEAKLKSKILTNFIR